MFAAVMMPSALPIGPASPEGLPTMPSFASSPFRPSRPSPLSSSPIRASSSPPASSSQTYTQSSPIKSIKQQQPVWGASSDAFSNSNTTGSHKSLFRFASRPTKAVARGQQARDAAQQTRRSLFLRNVRQRADNRSWDRRNFEQELQRMEWFSSEEEVRRAREAEAADLFASQDLDEDIEASVQWAEEDPYATHKKSKMYYDHDDDNDDMIHNDERIADLLAMEEESEMERLLALEEEQAAALPEYPPLSMQPTDDGVGAHGLSRQPSSVFLSDDGEYDDIFAELASAAETEDTEMSCI